MSDILVVDANPLNVETYRGQLESAGYRVESVDSGHAALERLATPWPDLVIVDVHVPETDGVDVCRRIRAEAPLRDIPILFVTARDEGDSSIARGLAFGASDYLVRPFSPMELLARVAIVARQRHDEVALRERTEVLEQVVEARNQALETSERRFRGVVESAAEAICLIDRRGYFTEVNPMACTVLGLTRTALIGRRVGEFLDREEYLRLRHDALRTLKNHGTAQLTCTVVGAGAERIPAEMSASWVEGQLLVLGKDVRERRRMEEQLRRSDRMHAIAQLATGLVHEIRNPLTGISATLHHWQRQGGASPERQEATQRMLDEVERLEHLLRELLNFANPRRQWRQEVRVVELFRQVRSLIEPQIVDRNGTFTFSVEPQQLRLHVDPHQMEQVLLNLCLNALHAVSDKGVIKLRASRAGDHVAIEVKDNGCGIPPEVLPHIFEPFYSARPGVGSSGLGLSVAQRIVQDHGGEILVATDPPHGTTFTLLVPSSLQPR
ncbi:MAG: response regulator [Nitrospirota bacterium]